MGSHVPVTACAGGWEILLRCWHGTYWAAAREAAVWPAQARFEPFPPREPQDSATLPGCWLALARKCELEPNACFLSQGLPSLSRELRVQYLCRVPGMGRALLGGGTLPKKLWSPGFSSPEKHVGICLASVYINSHV